MNTQRLNEPRGVRSLLRLPTNRWPRCPDSFLVGSILLLSEACGGRSSLDTLTASVGGVISFGGVTEVGGTLWTGGTKATGGSTNFARTFTGGTPSTGGSAGLGGTEVTGGTTATGGVHSTGGTPSTGGSASLGGTEVTGGAQSTGGSTNAKLVATAITGWYHTCAVLNGGTIQCWGNNGFGQLGNGSTTNSSVPVTVSGITDAVTVASGYATHLRATEWRHRSVLGIQRLRLSSAMAPRRTVLCLSRSPVSPTPSLLPSAPARC